MIADSDGRKWIHAWSGTASAFDVPVVDLESVIPRLVIAMDERPVLEQTPAGLPRRITVLFKKWQPDAPGFRYERE